MNEELQRTIVDLLTKTSNFVGEQTPELIKELLRYSFICNVGYIILGLIVFSVFSYMCRRCYVGYYKSDNDNDKENYAWGFWLNLIIICAVLALTLNPVIEAIKIKTAPKIFVLEYSKKFIK